MDYKRNYCIYILYNLLCFLLFVHKVSYGQDNAEHVTYKGANVSFIFNTLNDYKNPGGIGKEQTNHTRIKFKLTDVADATSWELRAYTDNNDFDGADGNTLSPTALEVKIESVTPVFPALPDDFLETSWKTLSSSYVVLMSGKKTTDPLVVEFVVDISFRCGYNNAFWNQPWDYYADNINFTITSLP